MKVLLIGKGYWGSIVIQKLIFFPPIKVTVADSESNLDEMLRKKFEFVFVCTPTNTHYEIVKKCIENKRNIFCEKPFTGNYKKAKELYSLAFEHGIKIYVNNIFLYRNEFQAIKNLPFNNIIFKWSNNCKKDTIYNNLLYHDLYMLIEMAGHEWKIDCVDNNRIKLKKGQMTAIFLYNNRVFKNKEIIIDNHKVSFNHPLNDPLSETIFELFSKQVNYDKNKILTLQTLELINYIKNYNI
jgi:hypothetical protein